MDPSLALLLCGDQVRLPCFASEEKPKAGWRLFQSHTVSGSPGLEIKFHAPSLASQTLFWRMLPSPKLLSS